MLHARYLLHRPSSRSPRVRARTYVALNPTRCTCSRLRRIPTSFPFMQLTSSKTASGYVPLPVPLSLSLSLSLSLPLSLSDHN